MTAIGLRPKARSDLATIWDYTNARWGRDRARQYIRDLNRSFEALAEQPALGRRQEQLAEGLRVYRSGRHLIFYIAVSDGIDVIRVLHDRMDSRAHLTDR